MATKKKAANKPAKEKPEVETTIGERNIEIRGATIKDMLLNYDFINVAGVGIGNTGSIKGVGVVDDDLLNAMAELNVHLACIDDAFKIAGFETKSFPKMNSHVLTANYVVTGIKIKGESGDESVVITGTKFISVASDHMELTTPKIALKNGSSYKWAEQLLKSVEKIQEESALYVEGKYTEKEPKEPKVDKNQTKMFGSDELQGTGLETEFDEEPIQD